MKNKGQPIQSLSSFIRITEDTNKLKVPPKECNSCGRLFVPTKESKDICLFCIHDTRPVNDTVNKVRFEQHWEPLQRKDKEV